MLNDQINQFVQRFNTPVCLIWDDSCKFCERSKIIISFFDIRKRVFPVGKSKRMTVPEEWTKGYDDNAFEKGLFVRGLGHDDRPAYGFYALRRLCWCLPIGWLFLPLLYIPGIPWIGAKLYAWVAKNRKKLGGCSDECSL